MDFEDRRIFCPRLCECSKAFSTAEPSVLGEVIGHEGEDVGLEALDIETVEDLQRCVRLGLDPEVIGKAIREGVVAMAAALENPDHRGK